MELRDLNRDQLDAIQAYSEKSYKEDLIRVETFFADGQDNKPSGLADVISVLFKWKCKKFYIIASYRKSGNCSSYHGDYIIDQAELDEKYPGIEHMINLSNKFVYVNHTQYDTIVRQVLAEPLRLCSNLIILPADIVNIYEDLKKAGLIAGL